MVDLNKEHWTITPVDLSNVINSKRKELNKSPIDHSTMMTHLVLKSKVSHPGLFDFEATELRMDTNGIKVMEGLLNEQFGLRMDKKLSRHCTMVSPVEEIDTDDISIPDIPVAAPVDQNRSGLLSKLSRMFGR